jgi:hypothetical protein
MGSATPTPSAWAHFRSGQRHSFTRPGRLSGFEGSGWPARSGVPVAQRQKAMAELRTRSLGS